MARPTQNFGVNQSQIHQIINLLSLELENLDHMKSYVKVYKEVTENKVEGSQSTTKLILDS